MSSSSRRRTAALAVLVALATGGTATGTASAVSPAPDRAAPAAAAPRVVQVPVEDGVLRSAPRRPVDRGTARATTETLTVVPGVPGRAVSTWRVDYVEDETSSWTAAQKAAFDAAVRTWAGVVQSSVPIEVTARMEDLGEPDLLGETSPVLLCLQDEQGGPVVDEPCLPSALMNAREGADVYDAPDLEARFNSAYRCGGEPGFSYRLDGQVPACRMDFPTVVLHELAHGLGFMGSMWVEPGDTVGTYQEPHDRWDELVADAQGPLLDAPNGSTQLADRLQGGALRWTGAWGKRANGGTAPVLYAPDVFEPGSSYSHLDEATYPQGSTESLMTPMLNNREVVREPGSLARGLLRDLGWTVAPERAERGVWSSSAGSADVVERRADGSVDLRTWTSAGLSPATLLGGAVRSAPAVVRRPSGALEVFARGTDDALWTRSRRTDGGWSSWTSLGGKMTGSPAVSRLSGDELHVFVRGPGGTVWTRRSASATSGWGAWSGLGGSLADGSSPAAVSVRSGTMDLVVRWSDDSVHRRTFAAGRWGKDVALGGRTLGSPSAAALGGTLLVAAVGTDQAVWTRTPSSGWSSAGGVVLAGPAVAAAPGSTSATVFATGRDERLWVNTLSLPSAGAGATPGGWKAGQP